jgi:hypothetical protein
MLESNGAMMNSLLCLPEQVVHANLRGTAAPSLSDWRESLLRVLYSVLPCLRGEFPASQTTLSSEGL